MKSEQEIINKLLKLYSRINDYQSRLDLAERGEDTKELEDSLKQYESEFNAYMWLFS